MEVAVTSNVVLSYLDEVSDSIRETRQKVIDPIVHAVQSSKSIESDLDYAQGVSLLGLKCDALLAYMHNLLGLICGKSEGLVDDFSLRDHPMVDQLIKHRLVLDHIKPMEKKLGEMIDKILMEKKTGRDQAGRPKLENFLGSDSNESQNEDEGEGESELESESDVDNNGSATLDIQNDLDPDLNPGQVYRPPKNISMPYRNGGKADKLPTARRTRLPAGLQDDYLNSETGAPIPISATGTGVARSVYRPSKDGQPGGSSSGSRLARELAELERYEEDNFVRVSYGKKALKRRRKAEENVAMGFEGAGSGRLGRGQAGGFDAEFGDLLQRPSPGRAKKSRQSAKGREEDVYSSLNASARKRPASTDFAERPGRSSGQGLSGIMARHKDQRAQAKRPKR